MSYVVFLTLHEVINIHGDCIDEEGGLHGIRDLGLLESAVLSPQATFANDYLCADIYEMTALYAFGIIKNHPFIDGNKRTGMLSALLFLDRNGFILHATEDELYNLALDIASSKIQQTDIAQFFKAKTSCI